MTDLALGFIALLGIILIWLGGYFGLRAGLRWRVNRPTLEERVAKIQHRQAEQLLGRQIEPAAQKKGT